MDGRREPEIDLAAVRACADVIVKCATLEPNGFANLQFAALANVKAGAPFLPAAYHDSSTQRLRSPPRPPIWRCMLLRMQGLEDRKTKPFREIEKHGKAGSN